MYYSANKDEWLLYTKKEDIDCYRMEYLIDPLVLQENDFIEVISQNSGFPPF